MPKVVLEQNWTRIEDGKRVVSFAGSVADVPGELLEQHPYLAQRDENGKLLAPDAPSKADSKGGKKDDEPPPAADPKGGKK